MKKRLLSGLIVISIMLSACAVATAPAAAPAAEPAPAVQQEAAEPAAEAVEPAAETAEEAKTFDEITNINVVLCDFKGTLEKNADEIKAKVNEITEKNIGVHANIKFIDSGNYGTQFGLSMASGEVIDVAAIIPLAPTNFTQLIANSQLMDITEYLENDAPETVEMMGEYLGAMSIDGRNYGVPCFRNYASAYYIFMRKDILEDLGLVEKAQNITTWSGLEEVFEEVKNNTDLIPTGNARNIGIMSFGMNSDTLTDVEPLSTLGDSLGVIYNDETTDTISMLLEHPSYRKTKEYVRGWWDKGYIYKDSIVTDDQTDTMIKTGVIFCGMIGSELGVETAKKEATGYEQVVLEVYKTPLQSGNINSFGLGVPVTATEPEAALRWINELNTNVEIENLLIWGVEGTDYVVKDGQACYKEGEDVSNVRYHNFDFMYGNFFNALPWDGQGADFRQEARDFLAGAPVSKYLGLQINLAGNENLVAALNTVTEKYKANINYGNFTDEYYDEYIAALKTAGAEELIAIYQEQLDAWLAAQ